jgi:hypothetical protein
MTSRIMEGARKQFRRQSSLRSTATNHLEDQESTSTSITTSNNERGREEVIRKRRGRRSRSFDATAFVSGSTATTSENTKTIANSKDDSQLEEDQQPVTTESNDEKSLSNMISAITGEARRKVRRRLSLGSTADNFDVNNNTAMNAKDSTNSDDQHLLAPNDQQQRGRRATRKRLVGRSRSFDSRIFARPIKKSSEDEDTNTISQDPRAPRSFSNLGSADETKPTNFSLRDAKDKAIKAFEDAKRLVVSSKNQSQLERVVSDSSISLPDDHDEKTLQTGTTVAMDEDAKETDPEHSDVLDEMELTEMLNSSLPIKQVPASAEPGNASVTFLQLDMALPKPRSRPSRRSSAGEGKRDSKMKKKSWKELLAKSPSVRVDLLSSEEQADPQQDLEAPSELTEPKMAIAKESEEQADPRQDLEAPSELTELKMAIAKESVESVESVEPISPPKQTEGPEQSAAQGPLKNPRRRKTDGLIQESPMIQQSPSLRSPQRKSLEASSPSRQASERQQKGMEKSAETSSKRSDTSRTNSTHTQRVRTREMLLQTKEKDYHPRAQRGHRRRSRSSEKARIEHTTAANNTERAADQEPISRRGRRSRSTEKSMIVLQKDKNGPSLPKAQRNTRLARRNHVVHRRPKSRDRASEVVLKVGVKPRSSETLAIGTKRRISDRNDKRRSQSIDRTPGNLAQTRNDKLLPSEHVLRKVASDVVLKVGDKPRSSETLGMATKRRISDRNDKRRSQSIDRTPGNPAQTRNDKLSPSEHVLCTVDSELPGFLTARQHPRRSNSRDRISQSEHGTGKETNAPIIGNNGSGNHSRPNSRDRMSQGEHVPNKDMNEPQEHQNRRSNHRRSLSEEKILRRSNSRGKIETIFREDDDKRPASYRA